MSNKWFCAWCAEVEDKNRVTTMLAVPGSEIPRITAEWKICNECLKKFLQWLENIEERE